MSGFNGNGSSTVLVTNRSDDGRDLFEYFRDITRRRDEDLVALVFVEFLVIIFYYISMVSQQQILLLPPPNNFLLIANVMPIEREIIAQVDSELF